jgi:hypothetical protein
MSSSSSDHAVRPRPARHRHPTRRPTEHVVAISNPAGAHKTTGSNGHHAAGGSAPTVPSGPGTGVGGGTFIPAPPKAPKPPAAPKPTKPPKVPKPPIVKAPKPPKPVKPPVARAPRPTKTPKPHTPTAAHGEAIIRAQEASAKSPYVSADAYRWLGTGKPPAAEYWSFGYLQYLKTHQAAVANPATGSGSTKQHTVRTPPPPSDLAVSSLIGVNSLAPHVHAWALAQAERAR